MHIHNAEEQVKKMASNELENLVKREQELLYRSKAEAFMPDKHKLIDERHRVLERIEEIRKKMDAEQKKNDEKWRDETLKQQLPNIRFAFGDAVPHLMNGSYTHDVVAWEIPKDAELVIGKRKVNLRKLISPIILRHLLEKPFAPIYFTIQPMGAVDDRTGNPVGLFISREYEDQRHMRLQLAQYLAIMKV